jgi:hypothetical protein
MRFILLLLLIAFGGAVQAQSCPMQTNAQFADPSATEIRLEPLSPVIGGYAYMQAVLENASLSANGRIPAGTVYITISFPDKFGINVVPNLEGFNVVYTELGPAGTLHLVNNEAVMPGDVLIATFPIKGYSLGAGTATFNVDRVSDPCVMVANTQTANDNSSVTLNVTTVLPLIVSDFSVIEKNCNAVLSWTTQLETDGKYFIVEKSNDGMNYNTVTSISPRGTPGNYSITVDAPTGNMYYRLKLVNENGTFTYTPAKLLRISCTGKNFVSLYPNPVTSNSTATLSFKLNYQGKAAMAIVDASGRVVANSVITVGAGINNHLIDTRTLLPGVYFVKVSKTNGEKLFVPTKMVKY